MQERVELFAIELQEEKLRVVRMLTWMCAAILLGTLALAFASVLLIVVFWETARVAVVAGLRGDGRDHCRLAAVRRAATAALCRIDRGAEGASHMDPRAGLNECRFAAATLRRRIAGRRERNAELVTTLAQPLRWVDVAAGVWRDASWLTKVIAVPVAVAALRWVAPGRKGMALALQAAPWIAAAFRVWTLRAVPTTAPSERRER